MGKSEPNLVFIFTDQQRYDTMSVYGNDKIKAPNLNNLSKESAVFKRPYVTQPVCTPSRGTIVTGLYPHTHGCVNNNMTLNKKIPTIADFTKKHGYKTAYMGKWHIGNEVIKQHGFDKWVSSEDGYRKHYTKEEYKNVNCDYYFFLRKNGFMPDREDNDFYSFSREFATRIPEKFSKPAFLAGEAEKYITENKNNKFVLYVNFLEPHPPWYSVFDDMYDPEEVELPSNFNSELPENVPGYYKYIQKYFREVGRHFPMKDEKTWRKLIARYWGAVSLIDKYTGKILQSLKDNGIDDNTVVVFTSDHGDMMGDFRMNQKGLMYDSSSRVPLLIKVPGVTDNQVIIEEPVSNVDLVPTLLDILGIPPVEGLEGKSLYPAVKGEVKLDDNDVFIEWNREGISSWQKYLKKVSPDEASKYYDHRARAVVTPEGWKMTLRENGENELYNMYEDPGEIENLYYDKGYSEKIEELKKKIHDWQKNTNDTIVKI